MIGEGKVSNLSDFLEDVYIIMKTATYKQMMRKETTLLREKFNEALYCCYVPGSTGFFEEKWYQTQVILCMNQLYAGHSQP